MAASSILGSTETMVPEQGLAAEETIVNNEESINPENASDGQETSLVVRTESDAGNGVLKKIRRGPRYFNSYGENEDKGKKHKPKWMPKRCYICGDNSHAAQQCRQVNACFICSERGHLVMECPNKNVKEDCASTPCVKCGNMGHDMFSCTNGYDPEDLKLIECYVCKEVGHLCCVDQNAEVTREATCYNCGQSGHFCSDCTEKVNEVPYGIDLDLKCRKCGDGGHSKKNCAKVKAAQAKAAQKDGATTQAEKKETCNARRRKNTKRRPTSNASQPNREGWVPTVGSYYGGPPTGYRPSVMWRPPILGPYFGKPGSNVWLSPQAAAARPNLSHQHVHHNQVGVLPQQHVHHNLVGVLPLQHVHHNQVGVLPQQHVHHNLVGAYTACAFGPPTRFPHQYQTPKIGTQVALPFIDPETGAMLPQTPSIPDWHYDRRPKLLTGLQIPETESAAPQTSPSLMGSTSLSDLKQLPTFSGSS